MKNVLLWGLLLACSGYIAANAYSQYGPADPVAFVLAERQVMRLPEDGNAYYTTIFNPTDRVVDWFDSDARLKSLRKRTHFSTWEKADPMFSRYKRYHGNSSKTIVLVQDPYGRVVYSSASKPFPKSPSALADAIQGDIEANCHLLDRWRERRNPTPEPEPKPDEEVEPDFVDDEEAEGDPGSDFPFLLAGLGLLIGVAFGVGTSYYEQYYAAPV